MIPYGPGERHRIDFFAGDGAGPIVVFIHGGYWQALDGSFFSHLAGGLNAHGIDVAIPSYDLCPDVSIDDIIRQMRLASRELAQAWPAARDQRSFGRRASCGLHAGDRLAGIRCVVAARRSWSRPTPFRACSTFGPLVKTSINKALQTRRRVGEGGKSVVLETAARGSLDAVVGGNESAEYFRQSRIIVDTWGAAGVATRSARFPTPTILPRSRRSPIPTSPMTLRLKQLAGR